MKKERNIIYNAALYGRLSNEDDKPGESESITTQETVLVDFCEKNGIEYYEFYADDDYSGANFDRPAFKKMMAAFEEGRHNILIVKDLSRLGRDAADMTNYLEKTFPAKGIRVVAVFDNYDSEQNRDYSFNFDVHLKNMFNEYYLADTSHKTRSALAAKTRHGEYVTAKAPYGYEKDPMDKHKLIIDEEAAAVVYHIFDMLANKGYGYNKIAKTLCEEKVLTPRAYDCKRRGKVFLGTDPYDWNLGCVKALVDNEAYIGNLIRGMRSTVSYKVKKVRPKTRDMCIVVEGVIPPIIPKDLWDDAHEKVGQRKRTTESGFENIFAGLVRCDTCGKVLGVSSMRGSATYYCCDTYKKKGSGVCSSHYTRYTELYDAVYQDIRRIVRLVKSKGFTLDDLLSESATQKAEREKSKRYEDTAEYLQAEIDRLDSQYAIMYKDRLDGILSPERFAKMSKENDKRRDELQDKLERLQKVATDEGLQYAKVKRFADTVLALGDVKTLTAELLNSLISKIVVGERVLIDGKYRQDITVFYKFQEQ